MNILSPLTTFLRNRKQRVILKDKSQSQANIDAAVPQGSILGLIVFQIYINDLCDNLQCNTKLMADDTFLFFTDNLPKRTANKLNNDLKKINKWAFRCKIRIQTQQSKLKRSFLVQRLLIKFILKYFSIIFQLIKSILKIIWVCTQIQNYLLTFI